MFKKLLFRFIPVFGIAAAGVAVALATTSSRQVFVAHSAAREIATQTSLRESSAPTASVARVLAQNAGEQPVTFADPVDKPEPEDVYANFKKYYRGQNGYVQNANTNLSGLGTATAISLSGFLPTTASASLPNESITITELELVDVNGAIITNYRVVRVNYLGPSTVRTPTLTSVQGANNYGLTDRSYAAAPGSALLAANIAANVSFSIEIELAVPTILTEIRIAQVLPLTSAGTTVLGSVGILTTQAAYRLYDYKTPIDIPASDGSKTSFALGTATSPLNWVRFSELGDTSLSYVLVPKIDVVTAAF